VLPTLRSVDARREIIFLDQRGTGASNPLDCPRLDLVEILGGAGALVRQCAAALSARANLELYSSLDAVKDLEDLRAALGHERINLVGVSYGVRVALLYMRAHGRRVRSAILRAAYPIDYNILADGSRAADAQLKQVVDDCGREAACRQAYPQLREQLAAIDRQLALKPAQVTAEGADGGRSAVTVTRALFHHLLLAMMQSAVSRRYIPLLISTAAVNGFQPFATQFAQLRAGLSRFPVGMYLSVVCAEDARRRSGRPAAAATPFQDSTRRLAAACSAWPVRAAPAATLAPFVSDVPTLLVSGSLDPVTPAEGASRLAGSLRNGRHLVVPAVAHGPMFPDCVRPAVAAFIDKVVAPALDPACSASALAPFALPAPSAAAPPAAAETGSAAVLQGTWDLEWRTARGSSPGGYLVISQSGGKLDVQLHGRGSLRASGTLQGNSFTVRGSRMFIPYTLAGSVSGDRIEGTLKVMSVERQFVGRRRANSGP
jgi:pimeloyl-ACP methyl ester carboxylesterase